MLYEVEADLNQKDMDAFVGMDWKVNLRSGDILKLVLGVLCIMGILVRLAEITLFRRWVNYEMLTRTIVLFLIVVIFFLRRRLAARQTYRINRSVLKCKLQFYDTEIQAYRENSSSKYKYAAFCAVYHRRDCYYLYMDKVRVLILPERCFTLGDPSTFGAFLEEKCGMKIKEIK